MSVDIIAVSRRFFEQAVRPLLERSFPEEARQMACGVFGYGSECLGMDDAVSRDHHWGLRIDALMPDALFRGRSGEILARVGNSCPIRSRGSGFGRGT